MSDTSAYFDTLDNMAKSNAIWRHPIFEELSAGKASSDELQTLLVQFFYYVKGFASRLCVMAARAQEDYAKAALAPNIYEELGADQGPEATHVNLVRRLLQETGADRYMASQPPLPTTLIAEMFFEGLCVTCDPWDSFFAMGPGTESISDIFLNPMEQAMDKVFGMPVGTVPYFIQHYPQTDMAHAEAMRDALVRYVDSLTDAERAVVLARGKNIAQAAVTAHGLLFQGIWDHWQESRRRG